MAFLATTRTALLRSTRRSISTCTTINPPENIRNLALPLAFLSLNAPEEGKSEWHLWSTLFAEAGYTSHIINLDASSLPSGPSTTSPSALLAELESELSRLITSHAHFPPLLFSSSLATLVAETYVSSHPLSGLVLHQPASPVLDALQLMPDAMDATALNEFTYEPNFPIIVIEDSAHKLAQGRLVRDFGPQEGEDEDDALVKALVAERNEEGFKLVLEWMDENGL